MPSASPRATTTMRTSSRSERPAELLGFVATGRPRRPADSAAVFGGFAAGRGVGRLVGGSLEIGLLQRLRVDRLAGHLGVLRRRGLGRGIVQQAALEDLRAAARALDDLEVDLDAVTCGEPGDAAQLGALEAVDDGAHGEKRAACQKGRRGTVMDGSEEAT